jgi:hypothetical protein
MTSGFACSAPVDSCRRRNDFQNGKQSTPGHPPAARRGLRHDGSAGRPRWLSPVWARISATPSQWIRWTVRCRTFRAAVTPLARARTPPAVGYTAGRGPVAQLVRAGDSSHADARRSDVCGAGAFARETREVDGMNSGKPQRDRAERTVDGGNPEPSRRCTAGRCRDYLRASSALDHRRRASRTLTPSRDAWRARVKR